MLKLIERSPNLGPLDALANLKTLADSMFYNHATNISRFDSQTLRAWAKSRGSATSSTTSSCSPPRP